MTGTLSPGISESSATLELASLLEPVSAEMKLVEEWLRSNLIDDSQFVASLLSQVFKAGGKRIRPGLVLLSSRATAPGFGELTPRHIILAVLTELIHTASLYTDISSEKPRCARGRTTANER